MRIVLAAGKRHGCECFKDLLAQKHQIVAVFTRKNHPYEPIDYYNQFQEIARTHAIPFYSHQNLNTSECRELLLQLQPELMIVIKWHTIISKNVYSIPSKGCVILHDSLLPRYRGFAPVNWAIINGERETGATLFFPAEDVDSGPIIAQERLSIAPEDTIQEVEDRVVHTYVKLLRENLPTLAEGKVKTTPQDQTQATYTCARTPEDNHIDWTRSALEIYNLVRALTVLYPGAYSYLNGQKTYILGADLIAQDDQYVGRIPGRVIRIEPGVGVQVLAGKGIVRVKNIQPEGQPVRNATDLIRSIRHTFK